VHAQTSSAPGTLMPVGMDTREKFVDGRESSTTMSVLVRIMAFNSSALMLGVPLSCSMIRRRLARYMHAGECDKPGFVQRRCRRRDRQVGVAGACQNICRARGQAVMSSHSTMRVVSRAPARKAQLRAGSTVLARPQQMIFREGEFLAQIDQREFFAVASMALTAAGVRARNATTPGPCTSARPRRFSGRRECADLVQVWCR